jgi:hypothetical protein
MSKYDSLWKHVQQDGKKSFKLTFEEIQNIAGIPVDHSCHLSFLKNYRTIKYLLNTDVFTSYLTQTQNEKTLHTAYLSTSRYTTRIRPRGSQPSP